MNNIELMRHDSRFNQLVLPIAQNHSIVDTEFYIHKKGLLFHADGYAHPENSVLGNPLYIPDENGDKNIFGQPYRKLFFYPKTNEPIPYKDRPQILHSIDPSLDQHDSNPWPFQYEQIIPISDFIGYISGQMVFEKTRKGLLGDNSKVLKDLEDLGQHLDINIESVPLAFTGALAFGNIAQYHDLDLVFCGSLSQNRNIADKIRQLLISEPVRRLHEGGKGWLIRWFNRNGDVDGTIMCCFFRYGNIKDAPLQQFEVDVLEPNMQIEASISDDTHALYTPTILALHDVHVSSIGNHSDNIRLPDSTKLIIYHTGSRGEFKVGDRIWANGAYAHIHTLKTEYPALLVIEREAARNLTPPWSNFYSHNKN